LVTTMGRPLMDRRYDLNMSISDKTLTIGRIRHSAPLGGGPAVKKTNVGGPQWFRLLC